MTDAIHISIITSLYRAEAYLPAYSQWVIEVAAQVKAAGLALEIVLVANDPSVGEQTLMDQLAAALESAGDRQSHPARCAARNPVCLVEPGDRRPRRGCVSGPVGLMTSVMPGR